VAGVLVALTIPTRTRIDTGEFSQRARRLLDEFDRTETGDGLVLTSKGQQEALFALEREAESVQAPLLRLEHGIQRLVQFGIMPLFAFANAGVPFATPGDVPLFSSATLGIVLGLVIGKPAGILLFTWAAVRSKVGVLPARASIRSLVGVAFLGGIGFTMSLFFAALAFEASLLPAAKIGILIGSALSALLGTVFLLGDRRR
jgi:NhaA family Na+:H+ antiporter